MLNCYFNFFQYEGGFNSFKSSYYSSKYFKIILFLITSSLEVLFILVFIFNPFNNIIILLISLLSLNIILLKIFFLVFNA